MWKSKIKKLLKITLGAILTLSVLVLFYSYSTRYKYIKEELLYPQSVKLDKIKGWQHDEILTFALPLVDYIEPTWSVFLVLNYTADYPYYNIHINYSIEQGDKILVTAKKDFQLFSDTTGTPLGKRILHQKVYKYKILLEKNFHPRQDLRYLVKIQHCMRSDLLLGIQKASLKIEH